MPRFLYFTAIIFALNQSVSAQITIHVLNPWASNPTLSTKTFRLLCYESWYPGVKMINECNNWYTWTLSGVNRTSNDHFQFAIDTGNQQAAVKYPADGGQQLIYSNIFSTAPANANEVWILASSPTATPQFSFTPPTKPKVLHILNPWNLGVPRVQVKSKGEINLLMKADAGKCGWFEYDYFGCMDTIQIRFMNSVDSTMCGMSGKGDSTYIDLTTTFSKADTVWISPPTASSQILALQPAFPGTLNNCNGILLAADMHDIGVHPDFDRWNYLSTINCAGVQTGQVEKKLGANGLPVKSKTTVCPQVITQFDWFDTKILKGTYTNETCYNLKLQKNEEGYYYYDDSLFYPIDNFKYLDSAQTIINPNNNMLDTSAWKDHNNHFTMIISASFEYTKGQTFYFRGDDDVWVFIDSQLVVDLGGTHPPSEGAVNLDTLRLTQGKTYDFKLFYTERNCCGSSFRMVTSLNLRTNSNLFSKEIILPGGVRIDSMFQKITQNSLTCVASQTVIGTQPAGVDFYIEGPGFTQPKSLSAQTQPWFGGIIISDTRVQIDTASISGLDPGNYIIRYYLRSDKSQNGTITFTVNSLPADHFDILNDSMALDLKKDAKLDSIVIGYFDSTAQIYAVLRAITGAFIKRAALPTWTSRNPAIATVMQSAADQSRCIITKGATGVTWVVVSDPAGKIKPDSVKIITMVLPKYPVIVSAVMLDTNADITPDMLTITLNDTFKTNQRLDSISVFYRGTGYVIPAANVALSGKSIKVSFSPVTGVDAGPSGLVALCITTETGFQRSPFTFTDGVGPAIASASVMENDGSGADTLFVTFSEKIAGASLSGKQLLLIKAGTTDTAVLSVLQVLVQTNDSTFTLQVSSSGAQPKAGDRLRLLPGSKGGSIADKSKNLPHDLNRSVVLGLRLGPTAILSAWYRDDNADGIIDAMVVNFKRPIQQSSVKTIVAKWNSVYFDTVSLQAVQKLSDSSYSMAIHGAAALSGRIQTHVPMEVLVDYKDFPDLPSRSSIVSDSAAAVISSAKLVYSQSKDSINYDKLTVVFSEAVNKPLNSHPFYVKSKKLSQPYQFSVTWMSSNAETSVFRVDSIVGGVLPYASNGDSLWIDVASAISDIFGNTQHNPNNRRVALSVTLPPALPGQWSVMVIPNPFAAQTGQSTVITAVSKNAIMDPDQYTVTVDIYDIIGNMVITQVIKKPSSNKEWSLSWDGRNHNQRLVGSGVYLGIVKIAHTGEATFTKRVKIGVKR